MEAFYIFLYKFIGSRTDDGGVYNHMFKITNPGFFLQQPHCRTFNIKTAHGIALGNSQPGFIIIFRVTAIKIIKFTRKFADTFNGVPYNSKAAVPKKIYLYKAGFLCGIFFPLYNRHAFRSCFHRHIGINRFRSDHNSARVY